MSSQEDAVQVLNIWGLAIPLPAVLMITVSLYMMVLGVGLWIRYCHKDRCSCDCGDCCPNISVCEQCFRLAEMCNFNPPDMKSCWACCPPCPSCPQCPQFPQWDCSCQPPECDTFNCLCFEIRVK